MGGIVITGGGSNLKNIEQAFAKYTHIEKVRIAKFVTTTINSSNEQIKAHNGMYNTVLGLLAKGDINCAGNYIDPNGNLFEEHEKQPVAQERKPRQIHEIETGTIRTAQEEELAAEEARRKKAEEERIRQEEEERQAEEERKRKKENSIWNKTKKWLEGLASPEE